MLRFRLPLLASLLLGCNGETTTPPELFDHTRVWETFEHDRTYVDRPFDFEVPTLFRTSAVLPDLDVRSLALFEDSLFAGTGSGLFTLDANDRFVAVTLDGTSGPVIDLVALSNVLLVAQTDRIHVLNGQVETFTSSVAITAVAQHDTTRFVGSARGLFRIGSTGTTTIADNLTIRDLLVVDDTIWMATDTGIARYDITGDHLITAITTPVLADDDVRALTTTTDGTVLAATATGLAEIGPDGTSIAVDLPGIGSLPNGDLLAVSENNGVLLTGHGIGATARSADKKDHYHSLRWIPDERVTAVALGADGTRWLGTPAGITRIALEPTTLTEKALLFEQFLEDRHWRMDGFVAENANFPDPWDLSVKPHLVDSDNDGQWTETQVGAWCFAYAATGDAHYYNQARKAMDAMLMLFDVPAIAFEAAGRKRGFITRSLVRDDEGSLYDSKSTLPNWHQQEYEGRTYYWKDNTSADEYDGHYFGIPFFYDLCAQTEEEKEAIRHRIRLSTDYLIENDYLLIDLDGESTEDGKWDNLGAAADGIDACMEELGPDAAGACIFSRHGGGWLNCIEIMAYMLAAWHITGDQKYYDEYERLHTEERCGEMVPIIEDNFIVTSPVIANHSDHEMAMLVYATLLRYEPNEDRRAIWIQSMLDFYEYERAEHNPFQLGVISGSHAGDVDLDQGIQTLRDLPTDWRKWRVDNSHRQDAALDRNDRFGDPQFKTVFPYDEIRSAKWNDNPYGVVGGGNGRSTVVPMPYQIAYWMLRYYGVIEVP